MANLIEDQKLIQHEIHDEMKNSYIDYAMSVIVGRALPDVRDGLKPVHRRILYGMSELGVTPDKPYKKSARIVGEVMGKYHPHGDSSIYDAMVRMAQDFSMRYMFVDGHGNFGSVDGDGAAAMRYTEARMSPFSIEMLRDIKKDTVNFMPNFDEEEEEPTVLPARIPNLLVNGSNGIAVGMATSIPPHNLCEAIDACVMMIDNADCTVEDLMTVVKGPDFPTGAIINGKAGFKQAYQTGIGKVTVRARTEIEEGKRGRFRIIVTEIPYQVNKARLIEKIALLIKEKKIEGISDIRDESSREGMRIVIELKKDANPQITLNRLYKHTQLQENISMIMIALVNGEPKTLNLRDIIFEYLKHQKEVLTRRTQFDLAKAEARAHIVEGLRIALDNIDEVIKTIRSSYDDAKEKLMEKFGLSEIQAQAILDMRLARLQGLERDKLEEEYKELMKKIAYYKSLLADEKKLMGVVKDEMLEIRDKWGDERKTEVVAAADEIDEADLIEEEQVAITLTHLGYIKRIPADTYKTQKRGGRGITGVTTRENDFVTDILMTSTHQNLAFFTNYGKAYVTKAYEIPEATRTAKGTPAVNFLNLMQRERINAIMPISKGDGERYLIACTKKGTIKKTAISEFINSRRSGLVAIKLKDGDELVDIRESSGDDKVLIITKNGKCICFPENQVRPMGRVAGGVRAISLDEDDAVVSMELVQPESELLVVTQKGYGKRTEAKEYREQKRGGKGILTYDKNKFNKTGELIGATVVNQDDEIMLINSDGIIIRIEAKGIAKTSRATQGVKIMKVAKDANIISLAKVGKEQQTDPDNSDNSDENAKSGDVGPGSAGGSSSGNGSSGGSGSDDGSSGGESDSNGKNDSKPGPGKKSGSKRKSDNDPEDPEDDSEKNKTEESEQMTFM